ncbi:glycosyltransferase [Levilactobacillus koreensis JCM 16448]|uniref:Poly(Glycerol-phosphate) alpha-glucosyltransferase n=1 Tax=Levilactobacillus koreensis TaxID=637971 RepID=A0AAC8UWU8_9LACO|nr:glycosyltransferase [Levilactobacillus koreensis]AKP65501.1 poly(glycerol-phosphate) alpha-glucosyltransferase [Levilactobacillus koreensis]KRK87458.1 glycosyltransferase [Levilactobacillus koreensis JCM 16448]
MYYFLNDNMQYSKSGIEHAEINRLHLFKQHHVPAKIVTRIFSMDLTNILRQSGIQRENFVNLFEFFCGSTQAASQSFTMNDFSLPANTTTTRKDDQLQVFAQGKMLMIIYFRKQSTEISNVQYFDVNGRTVSMVWWDVRGFKCLEQFFDLEGKISQEQYYGPDGLVHLEKNHYLNRGGKECLSWRVLNYRNSSWVFGGMNELTRFFYDELNGLDQHNVFICDRTVECDWGLFHMQTPAFKVLHLHNDHVSDPSDMLHSPLNNNYTNALNNWAKWDAVISATPEQSEDVVNRFGSDIPAFTIPVGYVSDEEIAAPHQDFAARQKDLIVHVARLAPEKQQNHSIEAFAQVHKKFPDARLELWGYANGDIEKQFKQQVADAGLKDVVAFKGYTSDIDAVYDRAQIGVLPSRAEGFSLTLLEAQSHGVPMVANDVKYGPSDIIQDGVTGILTEDGQPQQLADALIKLLGDQKLLKAYSAAAYENAKRYSEDAVFEKWQQLLDYFDSLTHEKAAV